MSENFKNTGQLLNFLYHDCPFFWGKITQTKAKEILEGKPNGSFLLRERDITENSNFRFEVAVILRIANGKVCFDNIHSKIPRYYLKNCHPIHRTYPFSLLELSASKIRGSAITENGITELEIPLLLKKILRE